MKVLPRTTTSQALGDNDNLDFYRCQQKVVRKSSSLFHVGLVGFFPFYHEREIWWCSIGMNAGHVLGQQDFAIISQLRLIDTKRLIEKVGYMEIEIFEHIRQAVKGML